MRNQYKILQNKYIYITENTGGSDETYFYTSKYIDRHIKPRLPSEEKASFIDYLDNVLRKEEGWEPKEIKPLDDIIIFYIDTYFLDRKERKDPISIYDSESFTINKLYNHYKRSEEYAARKAQQQHTGTHGVDLTSLEETEESNYNAFENAVETLSTVEDFDTFLSLVRKFHKNHIYSFSPEFFKAIESKFGDIGVGVTPDPNTVGGAFWAAYQAAAKIIVWNMPVPEGKEVFDEWLEVKKVSAAQQQHTKTHGVNLSNLEEDSTKQEGIKTRRRNLIQALVALNNSEDSAKFAALALNNTDLLFVKEPASPGLYNLRFDIINIAEQVLGEKYTYVFFDQSTLTDYFISLLNILAVLAAGPIETKGFRFAKQLQPAALQKEYNKRFAIWVDANSAKKAQQQHTKTHGVDLSNLEENIDHYPANSSNNFFDVVKNAPDKNQFIDWLINKSNLAHDLQDARDNYMEPEFTASLSKKRANWMIVNVYYDAVLENRQYECEEFSDNPIECIEKEKERIKKEILDYYDQYKAYLAQIKHTGTHGVDLSAF